MNEQIECERKEVESKRRK